MLAWDATILDCARQPESAVYYRVRESAIRIIGWILQSDDTLAPVYNRDSWMMVDQTPQTFSNVSLPTPEPGEVILIDIEATDLAGNDSEECAGG